MATGKTTVFTCDEIVDACDAALNNGKPLSTVFSISKTARPGSQGCLYFDVVATVPGKTGRLNVSIKKEVHSGRISPADDAAVAQMNAALGGKYGLVTKRGERDPTVNFQMSPDNIKTDGGELPEGAKLSPFFKVVKYLDQFFYEELKARIDSGAIVGRNNRGAAAVEGAIVVPQTTIVQMYQDTVSQNSKTNPGAKLANPICRVNLKFDKDTGLPKSEFLDGTQPYRDPKTNKRGFKPLMFDGCPVTAANVHKIVSRTLVTGIVQMDAVCASNMGISVPRQMKVFIGEPPAPRGVDIDDLFESGLFDGEDFPEQTPEPVAAAPEPAPEPATAAPAAPAAVPVSAAPVPAAPVPENDLTQVLDDLSLGH